MKYFTITTILIKNQEYQKDLSYINILNTVISGVKNAEIYQSLALVLFILFFLLVIILVYIKPKDYYQDMDNLPLED